MIKALALHNEYSGCDYHRIRLPFQYGTEYVDNNTFQQCAGDLEKMLTAADLVVWNRLFPFGVERMGELRATFGFKLVVDLDDYWHLYPHHYLYSHYQKEQIPAKLVQTIKIADAVTVTTPRLSDKVREFNDNVHVIPNALPYGHGQFTGRPPRQDDIFRFLYAGQRSHKQDVSILKGPMIRIAGDRRSDIGFTLAGYTRNEKDKSGVWPAMEKVFSASGAVPNYTRVNQLPLDSYMSIYDQADAVLVPLEGNTFNSCKSNLKLLEAAAKKLPVICQRVPPYSDCEAPVLWVEKQMDWYRHIRYLAANRSAAEDFGCRLHEWATDQHNLFACNRYRFDLYGHIINS